MALPGSGPLSLGNIGNEQGISLSNVSLRSMSSTAGFSTPDSVSEFYGYSSLTYTLIGTWYLNDPCYVDTAVIYLGSDSIYYAFYGTSLYPMFNVGIYWYEYLYYDVEFGANVYENWEIDGYSTTLTDLGIVLSSC